MTSPTTRTAPDAPATAPEPPPPTPSRPHLGQRATSLLRPLLNLWLLAALLVGWEIYARANPTIFFPPLSSILRQFWADWLSGPPTRAFLSDQFFTAVVPSMSRLTQAMILALVVGVAGGMLVARNPVIRGMYSPMIRFWLATPKVVLLPVALQVFGVSDALNIFVIFFGTVWLIMINTADGVAGVNAAWLRSASSMRLSRWQLYRHVILPAAAPQIMAGIRVSIGVGLIMVIVSEFYATTAGVGYEVMRFQETFGYLQMWSAFLLIAIIGLILNLVTAGLERRALRWQRRTGLGAL
ncbi:ABC transporter permease subunit [Micromonospora sp. NPDC000207]|uniref:ABC transporter permease n=1 Tax=Micromonospora sp. NPDC000207 TaxID=3154246 RepID=UPI0033250D4D